MFEQTRTGLSPETNPYAGSTGITLRRAKKNDRTFLFDVYASAHDVEHANVASMETRFAAFQADCVKRFPNSEQKVVLVDGVKVGSIWVARWKEEVRLLDVALLAEHRNQGIGTFLLRRLQAEAADGRKPLRYAAPKINQGAARLYVRLGFRVLRDSDECVELEWVPPGQAEALEQ